MFLQNFISEQNKEVAVAIDEKEVEQCLDMMVVENKVMIDDSIVYFVKI